MQPLVDTHCHLNFDVYQNDRNEVIEQAWSAGLVNILTIGIDLISSKENYHLARHHKSMYTSIGIHPNSAKQWNMQSIHGLEEILKIDDDQYPNVVSAIGEIGLDYYRDYTPRQLQVKAFEAQLLLAEKVNLPVVIHTRNKGINDDSCMRDSLDILKTWTRGTTTNIKTNNNTGFRGVLHSFSGNIDDAFEAIEIGMLLGISGPVTFKNAQALKELVANITLDHLLLETDSPFLTPHPYRGKRNIPSNVSIIAEEIAKLKNIHIHEVSAKTTENAQRLFKWREH